jgi:hypothetical protein
MIRRGFPMFAATLLVIAVGVFAASLGAEPRRVYASGSGWSVYVWGGRVVASRAHLASSYISMPAEPSWRNAGGLSYERRRFAPGGEVGGKVMAEHLAVPTYPLPLAFGLVLAWWLLRWRRGARRPGRCTNCGYDLRASPERCQECGMTAK